MNSEITPTNPSYNMLQTLLGRQKYEEEMSVEQPPEYKNFFEYENVSEYEHLPEYKSLF